LLVILYTGWVLRHCGTLMLGDWKRAIVRRPLDVDFEPGRVPFPPPRQPPPHLSHDHAIADAGPHAAHLSYLRCAFIPSSFPRFGSGLLFIKSSSRGPECRRQ
jgi:hypothetical protein